MVIAGFQHLSLLDFPGSTCSIIFTQGCVFRCPYCHNPELISTRPTTTVSEESIFEYLTSHKKMLDGVCITGGEPTIQADLYEFIVKLKGIGFKVKLDTNGVHPELVKKFIAENLVDYFAMDLKHTWEKYQAIIKIGGANTIENCRKTFGIIQNSGVDHEFRTTICPGEHTEEDFMGMAGYLKDGEKYFIQATQFTKTLDPNLPHESTLRVDELLRKLQAAYPRCTIEAR